MLTLTTPLVELHHHALPRVGQKTAHSLAVEMAALTAKPDAREANVEDLLHYLPLRYEDRSNLARVVALQDGDYASVEVVVRVGGIVPLKGGRLKMYEFVATDGEGQVRAYWWNQVYLAKVFNRGTRVILYGQWKKNKYKGYFEVENPDYEVLADEDDDETNAIHTARRVPVYRKLGDFRTRQLRSIFHHVVSQLSQDVLENLPEEIAARNNLIARGAALRQIHFPGDDVPIEHYQQAKSPAHRRLIFEEFFWLAIALGLRRGERISEPKGLQIEITDKVRQAVRAILPFTPTSAQKRCLKEIVDDMTSDKPMNRLLQGDVGSGKTIVAVQALVIAVENGYQTALMAPTEILAEQHARNIKRWLAGNYRVELLTGSLRAKEKREVQAAIAAGDVDVVVGTHAVIQEAVTFHKLGFAVIDEQHRFGVMQRAALRRLGLNPDVLVMTATPIPRSLAMTVYGDLEVSIIDELPPGRTPIKTFLRWDTEEKRAKIYEFIRGQIKAGRQAYVVLPLIEESEKLDLRNATEMYETLSTEVFPEFKVGLLHGKLKPAEKEEVMRAFAANRTQILVATTVIEVGVDVPNASVMLIEHAERFGLSQLHQLRGRVGRGAAESYCILLSQFAKSKEAQERLKVMEETTDGFKIAEKDLEIRGPGEVLGTRQSGLPEFRIANIVRDQKILEVAKREAEYMLNERGQTRETDKLIQHVRSQPRFGLARVG